MARVSTYLNFERETEAAFAFYKSVFGTDYEGPLMRFSEMPPEEGAPPLPEEDKNLVMHVALPITAGYLLMGSDMPESMGMKLTVGNNSSIMLELDSREETEGLFKALSAGGKIDMELGDMFWGDYFGSFTDKFGVQWMVSCPSGK